MSSVEELRAALEDLTGWADSGRMFLLNEVGADKIAAPLVAAIDELAAARERIARMEQVVRAMANLGMCHEEDDEVGPVIHCSACHMQIPAGAGELQHNEQCPTRQARALLEEASGDEQ